MKATIEITKRYTFVADVVNTDEAEKIKDQLLNMANMSAFPSKSFPLLPEKVSHRGTDVDGAITFVKIG